MWAYQLCAPATLRRVEVADPDAEAMPEGSVLLRMLAGGVCGSDLPHFRNGWPMGRTEADATPDAGFPMHEVVGEVVASRHPDHEVGSTVVGWATGFDALAEYCVTAGDSVAGFDAGLRPAEAVVLQPLACVLYAVERMRDPAGADVAVLGLGPIGLLFSHVLKQRGARRVVGVDLVDRAQLGRHYGIDEVVNASTTQWRRSLGDARPDIVVEAIGHQVSTLVDAVEAVRFGGSVFYFGMPDDAFYPFPMLAFLRKNLRLDAGVTRDRQRVLRDAGAYLQRHSGLLDTYVSAVVPCHDQGPQSAFDLAARPAPGRLKVVLSMD
ncbi:zinc-binding dehydrogenase [Dactylosporangium sp. NPDC051485]|uniref:zinc-binding dehydrogenase n=1 Tax=Dactylosporangium sp. NPDC051485 TaxID=3154846 RepID=UPI0034272CDE